MTVKMNYGKVRLNLAKISRSSGGFVQPAMMIGAEVIRNQAMANAHVITGTLRRSIHIEPGPGPFEVSVGTDLEYAPYEEYGTRYRGPHPYLRPAMDSHSGQAQDIAGRAFWRMVEGIIEH